MDIPLIERAGIAEIKSFQEEKLREALKYAASNSPFYKKFFAEHNVDISTITSIESLSQLPVTTKEHLQEYNDDFLCVHPSKIIDYCTTSGTSGNPVTLALTNNDLERLAYNEALSFICAGIQEGDVVQLMTTIDRQFMAGLAYFLGLRRLGAGIIRVGAGLPELQWESILKYNPAYLITVPSFLLKLLEYAEVNGIDYRNSSVKGAICIGESIRTADFKQNALSKRITDKWNISLFSTYASTEMSTAFAECGYSCGGHHHPELIVAEILDEYNCPVNKGESGELTITTLGVEGMPLVRFKTGDIVNAHYEPCKCGRTTLRLGPVTGRTQQMIKYKGTTLYPPAMNDLLSGFPEVKGHVIIITTSDLETDEIIIKIAAHDATEKLAICIKDHFRARLRVTPSIEFITIEELHKIVLNPLSRKPITFIDKR